MARRNSVDVIARLHPMGAPQAENESCNVDVRRIDNGYITRESRCKGDQYTCTETYSREKPNIDAKRETNAGRETMRDAMKELRRSK